jgi:hypothetical protein
LWILSFYLDLLLYSLFLFCKVLVDNTYPKEYTNDSKHGAPEQVGRPTFVVVWPKLWWCVFWCLLESSWFVYVMDKHD